KVVSTKIYEQYSVPDSYRDKSELARSIQAEKRAEKRHKNKSLSNTTSSVVKKRKSNGHNKENVIEIIDVDKDLHFEQQEKRNLLEQELLNIQKQKNDELEREIKLIEK
ncbi:hypothetical protein C1646_755352, partial [Rhizophagus diaphanus]